MVNIGQIPAKYAKLDPTRPALIDIPNDRRMNYGTLDERVRRLANGYINDLGLKKEIVLQLFQKTVSSILKITLLVHVLD